MNKKKIKQYIVSSLGKIRTLDRETLKDIDNFDFINSGHLDSMEILKFNMLIENKFKIKITPNQVTSKNYKIVNGLINIIFKKLS
jgi:acyl carrier protein|tara:strand:+ start:684 stop:938 length:255 start_codon:yes stop_codon:yes gene_type:complete